MMIRKINPDDLSSVLKIDEAVLTAHWPYQFYRDEIERDDSYCLCMEDLDKLIGFVIVRQVGDLLELLQIGVDRSAQGQGNGQKLFDAILKLNLNKPMMLEVHDENRQAIRFYKRNGFVKVGQRKHYYGANKHAVVMRKDI